MSFSRFSYAFSALILSAFLTFGCGRSNDSNVVSDPSDLTDETTATFEQPAPAGPTSEEPTPHVVTAQPKFDAKGVSVDLSEIAGFAGAPSAELEQWQNVKVVRGKGLLTKGALETFAAIPQLTEFLWIETTLEPDAADAFRAVMTKPTVKKIRLQGLRSAEDAAEFPSFALKTLAESKSLVDLDISGSAIDAANEFGLVDLARSFPALTKLNLYQTNVGDAGVEKLLPLADRLTWLNLDDAGISPASAANIAAFSNLTFLHVGRSTLDDASVLELAKLTKLEKIHITRSGVTETGANALREALPNCVVVSQPEN